MHRWLLRLIAASIAAVPCASLALPCIVDTLDDYIALGSCEVDSTVFSDFLLVEPLPFPATPIDPSTIVVTPLDALNPGLQFQFTAVAGAGDLLSAIFEFRVTRTAGLPLFGASQTLAAASATGDGVSLMVTDLCLGGLFALPPSLCGGADTSALTTFVDSFGSNLNEAVAFAATPVVHAVVNFIVDGGPAGSATGSGGTLRFATTATPVDEPGTLLLVLAAAAWFARRVARAAGS